MSQHIGPRTISAQGGSIKRVGNYRIHTFPSELVTDGLVLSLDAGDPRSYPSSGTTWTDLSGNGNNGTLVNGPTYSNADGGSLVFDGTDDAITVATGLQSQLQSGATLEMWIKKDSNKSAEFLKVGDSNVDEPGAQSIWYASGILRFHSFINGASRRHVLLQHTISLGDGNWRHIVCTFNGNIVDGGTASLYINGSLITSTTNESTNSSFGAPGFSHTGSGYAHDGSASVLRVYNRALSAAEVAQNYDALRVRYGAYNNTFTPICAGGEGKVEVLCVAGGGSAGGAYYHGGGGGAGGLIYNSAFSVGSSTGVSVSVGRGGYTPFSDSTTHTKGENGVNSAFGTLTSVGGGGGGGFAGAGEGGKNGGSGGGAGNSSGSAGVGGSGTSLQGNDGGDTSSNTGGNKVGGGGGGAGGPGEFGGIATGGNGGSGLAYSISGTSQYYAGGGGGSTEVSTQFTKGGSGIGGDGNWSDGTNGIPNTGSGGGAGERISPAISGNGANGTVIVRYPATDYNVEVLVVGGGGSGGSGSLYAYSGGGGGAGGFIYRSSIIVSSGENIKISVGKGGAGLSSASYDPSPFGTTGNSGSNSRFGNLIAIGGGGGGGGLTYDGISGGSGGGGGGRNSTGGSGIAGQGFAGGSSSEHGDTTTYGAGGGGASSAGGDASNTTTAAGGEGKSNSITGSSVTYSVGGAGGHNAGTGSGTPVTNSGSGSRGGVGNGGGSQSGADGIVVVAYKGPQRGIGGTIDTTSRPGYTLHIFTTAGSDTFIP